MRAIGASNRGLPAGARSGLERRNESIQRTSRASTNTWRRFTAMPAASTARITPFKNGLAANICASRGASSAASRPTAARNAIIHGSTRRGSVIADSFGVARFDASQFGPAAPAMVPVRSSMAVRTGNVEQPARQIGRHAVALQLHERMIAIVEHQFRSLVLVVRQHGAAERERGVFAE